MTARISPTTFKPFLIGVGIISIGVVGFLILVSLRPEPPREAQEEFVPVVQTIQASESSGVITVSGSGNVRSIRESQLSVEVAGRVAFVAEEFVDGGVFRSGDVLLQIDPVDYENAVTVAEAEVTQRAYDVIIAREESQIARDEWNRLKIREPGLEQPEASELGSLLFKEPQVKLAEAAARAAAARLADAKSRLDRTTVRAPYNGRIRAKTTELGQYIAPGQIIASFYSTDTAEIVVPLRSEQSSLIENIYGSVNRRGAAAKVRASIAGETHTWDGYVTRMEGALDPATRTHRIVVRVPDPYSFSSSEPPLMVGTYAEVEITAKSLESYFEIPALAVRDGDLVWLIKNGKLHFSAVEILTRSEGNVIVTAGLEVGDEVIVSSLSIVSEGMAVRVLERASITN